MKWRRSWNIALGSLLWIEVINNKLSSYFDLTYNIEEKTFTLSIGLSNRNIS